MSQHEDKTTDEQNQTETDLETQADPPSANGTNSPEDNPGGAATAEQEKEETLDLEKQLAQAREEAEKNLEGWQRAAAELANFKRRQEEQMKLQRDRIKGETLEGVISALDDLELAFQNVPDDLDGQLVGWVEGFRLVQRKLTKILEDQNVMPIDTEGEFDPNFHEAISLEDAADYSENEIIAEVRRGYQIGSRVLRPALVRVAK